MNRLVRKVLVIAVATPSLTSAQPPASSRFVVRRGADTVATEDFSRSATALDGTVAASSGARTHYAVTLRPDASVQHLDVTRSGRESQPATMTTSVDFADTAAKIRVTLGEQSQTTEIVSGFKMLPYLDVSFALCEQIVRATHLGVGQTARITAFRIGALDTTTISVLRTHPDSVTIAVGQRTIRLVVSAGGDVVSATAAPTQPPQRPGASQSWSVERVAATVKR